MRPAAAAGAGAAKLDLPQDVSATESLVNWANWTVYLDDDDKTKKYPTLEAFKKKTGIKANYAEDIDDNDTYYGKIAGPAAGRPGHRHGHLVLHRLDGRPADPPGLRAEARP